MTMADDASGLDARLQLMGPVISRQAHAAYLNGNEYLSEAQTRADQLIEDAHTLREEIFEEARQAGFAQGEADLLRRIQANADCLQEKLLQLDKVLPGIIITCIRKIVGQWDDAELVKAIASETLETLRAKNRLVLRVAPSVMPDVQAWLSSRAASDHGKQISVVVPDQGMEVSSLVVETEDGLLDASFNVQLSTLKTVLEQQACHGKGGEFQDCQGNRGTSGEGVEHGMAG
ncbi:type III secretion system stator protein SctL [Aestuariispira insulae]|uniref:Type 3 secretion system stator protein n=1 Tax=Aestuariispira insulae TaxID=1461337 RepID=A0A3D9H2M9_9PROT|nr:type III secretion system stator protein SctL [Aestuariispira insulae]RED43732.1 type III secretion system HrpE/YscL family protein [Aestuariispira insulae]